ncbi:hypothetical protein NXX60_00305 [Bacteroides thetaiotaomicron]|nr:hypothetical protein NXX60_00305 [Bacteroides thetaiotaomicron]
MLFISILIVQQNFLVQEPAGEVAKSNWVEIDKDPVKNTPAGTVEFTLRRLDAHKTQAENGKVNTVSLQAAMTGDEAVDKGETNAVVRSTYQAVYDEILDADDVRIADDATLVEFGDEGSLRRDIRCL